MAIGTANNDLRFLSKATCFKTVAFKPATRCLLINFLGYVAKLHIESEKLMKKLKAKEKVLAEWIRKHECPKEIDTDYDKMKIDAEAALDLLTLLKKNLGVMQTVVDKTAKEDEDIKPGKRAKKGKATAKEEDANADDDEEAD